MKKLNSFLIYDDKGVTVVAVVVQIIIMIIIAGVVIFGAIGNNGIISMALRAAGIYKYDQAQEQDGGSQQTFTKKDLIDHFEIPAGQERTDVIGMSIKKEPVNMDYWEIGRKSEGFTATYIGPIKNKSYIRPKPDYIKKTEPDGTVLKGEIVEHIIEIGD